MPGGNAIVAIDVGTSKVCTVVAEATADGRTAILGVGLCPSRGIAKGAITDLDEASATIARAVERAERNSGYRILSAYVGLSGAHLRSTNSRGAVTLPPGGAEVTPQDVDRALEAAGNIPLQAREEVLHLVPRTYNLDGQEGVAEPVGLVGRRLEVEAHVISGAAGATRNVVRGVERAGVAIDELVPEPLAAARAALTAAERTMGAVLLDIGGGTTGLAVYVEGAIWHTAVLPIGGNHLTNDLSIVLQIPFESAEEAKTTHGRATPEPDGAEGDDADRLEVAGFEGAPQVVSRRLLHEVLEARLEQLLQLVGKELRECGCEGLLPGGVVLTGGTAALPEVAELTRQVLGVRARVGAPRQLAGLGDALDGPAFATAVGLAQWGLARQAPVERPRRPARSDTGRRERREGRRGLGRWLRELLP